MNVSVRDSIEADFEEIQRIRRHALVMPHQFKMKKRDTAESRRKRFLTEPKAKANFLSQSSTILLDKTLIVGHVTSLMYTFPTDLKGNEIKICECGWDLDPEYWGQGIMTTALRQLFSSRFEHDNIDRIAIKCFSTNERCIRLLERLEFQTEKIGWLSRSLLWISTFDNHKILGFKLESEDWQQ